MFGKKCVQFSFDFLVYWGKNKNPYNQRYVKDQKKKIMIEINVFRLMPVHVLSLQKINVWSNLCFKILLTIIDI